MTNAPKVLIAAALIATAAFCAVYIWPTRYRYDHISAGQYAVYLRIDRFTGEASRLDLRNNTWITTKMLADREAELKERLSAPPTPTPTNIFEPYIKELEKQRAKSK